MLWLWTEDSQVPKAEFDPLAGYTLRVTDSLNTFREKINILERGLDDRTIEIMKLLLFARKQPRPRCCRAALPRAG